MTPREWEITARLLGYTSQIYHKVPDSGREVITVISPDGKPLVNTLHTMGSSPFVQEHIRQYYLQEHK